MKHPSGLLLAGSRPGATSSLARIWVAAAGVGLGAAAGGGAPRSLDLAVAVGGALVAAQRRGRVVALAGLAAVAIAAGALAASAQRPEQSALEALARFAPSCRIVGTVLEQAGGLGTLVRVDQVLCDGHAPVRAAGPVVVSALDAHAGAEVTGRGWLTALRLDRFDRLRRRAGAIATFDFSQIHIGEVDGLAQRFAAALKDGLERASASLEPATSSLLRGMTFGDVAEMPADTRERLRRAGLSHLVAVSGSNVAIVIGAVAAACSRLSLRVRIGLSAIALGLFVVVVGPEPSVLRAGAMGALGLAALWFGRRARPLHALGLALIALIALRPGIVFSVGLHLSAAATAGIVLWSRGIERRLAAVPAAIRAPLAIGLAAQMAVAPVIAATFEELSVVAPAANLLALPAVAPATIGGLTAAMVGAVHSGAGAVMARLCAPFAGWVAQTGDWLGGPGWATVTVPRWTAWLLAAGAVAALVRRAVATPAAPHRRSTTTPVVGLRR